MPIPPLLVVALGLVGAAALVRLIVKERNRVNSQLQRARAQARADHEPRRSLRRDRDGIYRP